MQAVYRQDASMLLRSVLVHVPLAVLLTAVAVKLVQLGLAVTDAMSAAVSRGSGLDAGHFMGSVTAALSGPQAAATGSAPAFVLFLGALVVVLGAVLVWIELLLRAAAVYVAVLFLPLALASLAWPAIAHWSRRLVDTLVALVLGKFVIVSVLSLAAGALAGGTGSTPSGSGGGNGSGAAGGGGFGAVLGGAALLLLAALAPWALFRLLPFVEAGAVGHLEGTAHRARQTVTTPVRGLAQVAMRASVAGALGSGGGALGAASATRRAMAGAVGGPGVGVPGGTGGGAPGGTAGAAGPTTTGTAHLDDTPDPGPSTAEITGVGTAEPPGHGIPAWEIHPAATAAARYYLSGGTGPYPGQPAGTEVGQNLGPDGPGGPTGAARTRTAAEPGLVPLPRASGAPDVRLARERRARSPPHRLGSRPAPAAGWRCLSQEPAVVPEPGGHVRAERIRYRFPPLEKRGVVAGWRGGQIAAVALSLVVAVIAVRSRPSVGGIALAVLSVVLGLALAFWPIRGRTGEEWLPLVARWAWSGSVGDRRQLAPAPRRGHRVVTGGRRDSPVRVEDPVPRHDRARTARTGRSDRRGTSPPGPFGGLALAGVPLGPDGRSPEMAVVLDGPARTATAVLAVAGHSFALLGPSDQDSRVAAWARVLSTLAREGSEVHRLQWVESCLPDDGTAVRRYWAARAVGGDDSGPGRSYRALMAEAAPSTRQHRMLVALSLHTARSARTIRASGGGPQGTGRVLAREVLSLQRALEGAEVQVEGVVGRRALARILAGAVAPGAGADGSGDERP